MATLFFSYSHRDQALRDELEVHLSMLSRQGVIETWHDRRIVAGTEFDPTILAQIDSADIVLLLLSPDFLASDYCYDRETARALERHNAGTARVIPVILRPCDWRHPPVGGLLAAPTDGRPVTMWPNRDEAFLDITQAIRRAATETGAAHLSPTQPAPPAATAVPTDGAGPRSSNLRVRRQFTDADRDAFADEVFAYMARFFENSLRELSERNPGIQGRFRRIDATHFTATLYRDGSKVAGCRIWLGGPFTGGIVYSNNDSGTDNSYNESLSVEATEQALVLKPLGMAHRFGGGHREHLSEEGAAEYYWAIFIDPLQR